MAAKEDLLFGKIAVKNKLADEAQVRKCLALLEKSGVGGLGKLLLEKGIISASDYQRITAHVKQVAEKSDKPAEDAASEESSSEDAKAEAKPVSGGKGPPPSGPGVTVEELAASILKMICNQICASLNFFPTPILKTIRNQI